MKRRKHTIIIVLVAMAAGIVLVAGGVWAYRHDRAMHAALLELQAQNQVDSVFTSDSAALALVAYYDYPWHSANDRMLAYYLLGRAYADMGEAPQAIEAYQTAVERADTTDKDCDLRLLRNVYGQMAEVFDAQDLPEDEIEAQQKFNHYSWLIGDTLEAINGLLLLERAYYILQDTNSFLNNADYVRDICLRYGYPREAAIALLMPAYYYAVGQQMIKTKDAITLIKKESDFFDNSGALKSGYEMFYYTLGLYYEGAGMLDSAEYNYRQLLFAQEYEAGYKGLLSVYGKRGIADSIAKFASLYADANDAYHDTLRTAEVHKTASLYNYTRHLRIAKEEQRRAQGRLIALYITIIIILALVITGYYLYAKNLEKERKREHALNTIRESYYEVNAAYLRLRKESEERKNHTEFVKQRLEELLSQQEQLDILSSSLKERNKVGYYYSHDIVQGVIDTAVCGKHPIAGRVLVQLQELFVAAFPHFVSFVETTHSLTKIEWYVCILMDLGLNNSDIAFLTGYTTSRISNIKVQISHNLFQDSSSMSLLRNLRAKIHPISSKV